MFSVRSMNVMEIPIIAHTTYSFKYKNVHVIGWMYPLCRTSYMDTRHVHVCVFTETIY